MRLLLVLARIADDGPNTITQDSVIDVFTSDRDPAVFLAILPHTTALEVKGILQEVKH